MNKRQAKKVICPHGYYKKEKQIGKTLDTFHIYVPRIKQRYKWRHKRITSDLKKPDPYVSWDAENNTFAYDYSTLFLKEMERKAAEIE